MKLNNKIELYSIYTSKNTTAIIFKKKFRVKKVVTKRKFCFIHFTFSRYLSGDT